MASQDKVVLAASKISHAAPVAWDELMLAFAAYTEAVKNECIASPLETLPVAQGRAQQAQRVFDMLKDCRASATMMASRRGK